MNAHMAGLFCMAQWEAEAAWRRVCRPALAFCVWAHPHARPSRGLGLSSTSRTESRAYEYQGLYMTPCCQSTSLACAVLQGGWGNYSAVVVSASADPSLDLLDKSVWTVAPGYGRIHC